MTTEELARLFNARRVGPGRWMAKCPKHGDRSPSLSIRAGRGGLPLLWCFAGCDSGEVLATQGLTWREVRRGLPGTGAERHETKAEQTARELAEEQSKRVERRTANRHRRLCFAVDSLGRRLMLAPESPDGDALATLAHRACRMLCETQDFLGIGPELPMDAPARAGLRCSPFAKLTEEQREAEKVRTEEQLLRFIGKGFAEAAPAPEPWRWSPARAPDTQLGDLQYEAALDTLEELEALRGGAAATPRAAVKTKSKSPVDGARKESDAGVSWKAL